MVCPRTSRRRRLVDRRVAVGCSWRGTEALLAQFGDSRLGLLQRAEPHPAEHGVGLRELDLVVLHDLHAVAPGIDEAQAARRHDLGAGLLERTARGILAVDHETEVPIVVGRLLARRAE